MGERFFGKTSLLEKESFPAPEVAVRSGLRFCKIMVPQETVWLKKRVPTFLAAAKINCFKIIKGAQNQGGSKKRGPGINRFKKGAQISGPFLSK